MTFKFSLYFKELILFGSALFLGIFSANRLFKTGVSVPGPGKFGLSDLIILLVFISVLFLFRNKKVFIGFIFKLVILFVVIGGSQIVFGSLISFPFDVIASLLLVVLYLFYRNILVHNLAIIIGIAGLSTVIGLIITPNLGVIMLVLLSFYDIIAVYQTKHMIHMARSMIQSGAIFGFVIPSQFRGFISSKDEARARLGRDFMILGSGDIGLPLIMVCSLVSISLTSAVITAVFSLVGLLFTHLIFINQKERKPMAALPPIATMTIIGYLITLI